MQLARLLAPTTTQSRRRLRIVAMTDPTSRERDTLPPEPLSEAAAMQGADAEEKALREDMIRRWGINELLKVHAQVGNYQRELLDADGSFARRADERAERIKRETVVELGTIVDRVAGEPVRDLARRLGKLADGLVKIGETVELTRHETERNAREIEKLQTSYSDLKIELSSLRDQLFQSMARVDQLEERLDKQHSTEPTA